METLWQQQYGGYVFYISNSTVVDWTCLSVFLVGITVYSKDGWISQNNTQGYKKGTAKGWHRHAWRTRVHTQIRTSPVLCTEHINRNGRKEIRGIRTRTTEISRYELSKPRFNFQQVKGNHISQHEHRHYSVICTGVLRETTKMLCQTFR